MSTHIRTARRWNDAEDKTLQGILEQYKAGEEINWHQVASNIPGRNNKDCRKQRIYGLMPSLNKGPWREQEDTLLLEGVREHGFKSVPFRFHRSSWTSPITQEQGLLTVLRRWALVSQKVGTRQPDQCSRRWHESLNPDINHSRWSLLEDQTLKEAVQIYGRRWTEIVERYFPDRTPIAAKKRYAQRFSTGRKARQSGQDETGNDNAELSSSPGSVEDSENLALKHEPKLLWYMRDHSQKNLGPPSIDSPKESAEHGHFHPLVQSPLIAFPDVDGSTDFFSTPGLRGSSHDLASLADPANAMLAGPERDISELVADNKAFSDALDPDLLCGAEMASFYQSQMATAPVLSHSDSSLDSWALLDPPLRIQPNTPTSDESATCCITSNGSCSHVPDEAYQHHSLSEMFGYATQPDLMKAHGYSDFRCWYEEP